MTTQILRRAIAATLLVSASPFALAQSSIEDAPETLSTVIVTGVGPQRETDEMIGNASAVTRDEIVETLQASLGNTLDSQPGVSTTHFGQAASRPILRGLGAERVLVLTNGIGVIDASAASPDHQVASDGIDAEKIEILRGPAALAYGGQAIGGVVNVIDGLIVERLPDEPLSGEIYGAYNSVSDGTEGAAKTRFTSGPFVLSLSASARDFGDYDIPGFSKSARLRQLDPSSPGTDGTVSNSFAETGSFAGGLSWIGDDSFAGLAIRQQGSTYGLPGEEDEAPFIDLKQTRYDFRAGSELDYSPFTRVVGSLALADYEHTEFEAPGEPGTRYTSDGHEGRVELRMDIAGLDGAIGVQTLDKSLGAFGDEAFITPTDTASTGIFTYQTREWDNGFGLEGGVRYDDMELDNQGAGTTDFNLVSGSLGLHQHWENGWFIGGQVSWTERAPNESELFADGAHLATSQYEIGDTGLEKERGLNIEGTVRWRSDSLGIGANLFHAVFDGFIYLAPGSTLENGLSVSEIDGLPVFLFTQEDATFTGGEVYADFHAHDGPLGADWHGSASVEFVAAELDDGGNAPFIPPVTLNTSLDADWTYWKAGASLTIAGDQDDPSAGELPTDGYTMVDLRTALKLSELGFGADGTELFLEARNVTDEEVRYSTSVLKDTVPAPGRNIRGGVRLVF